MGVLDRMLSLAAIALVVGGCLDDPPTPAPVAEAVRPPTTNQPGAVSTALHEPTTPRVPHRVGTWARQPLLAPFFAAADRHRLQLLVRVVPGPKAPIAETHRFRVDAEYVYPASAIKTFAAVAALRLVKERKGVDATTPLARCLPDEGAVQCEPWLDSTNIDTGKLTVRHAVRRMQLVSDNRAFRTLFDLVGHERLHRDLWSLGFSTLRLQHRMGEHAAGSRMSPRMELWPEGAARVTIPARESALPLSPPALPGLSLGTYHLDRRGEVQKGPMSFAEKNAVGLEDMQALMVALLRPDLAGEIGVADLGLTPADRADLVRSMTMAPGDADNPRYLRHQHSVLHHKPMLPGLVRQLRARHLRYVNKSGRAYGFHIENAYLEDRRSGRGLFVTAAIYGNPNHIVNDDDYGYAQITVPFYEALGQTMGALLTEK